MVVGESSVTYTIKTGRETLVGLAVAANRKAFKGNGYDWKWIINK